MRILYIYIYIHIHICIEYTILAIWGSSWSRGFRFHWLGLVARFPDFEACGFDLRSVGMQLYLSLYIYVYLRVYIHTYIHIYIYIYIYNLPLSLQVHLDSTYLSVPQHASAHLGKGQMGSALMGSLQISCLLTEGLFGYSC